MCTCPECQGTDVRVECVVALTIVYDGFDNPWPELDDFDQIAHAHYDDDSVMVCSNYDCEHVGKAREFDPDGVHLCPAVPPKPEERTAP